MPGLQVAPFTGAWIEMVIQHCYFICALVAPFTGAWIEIKASIHTGLEYASLPSRERGLKWQLGSGAPATQLVAPFTGAWIEIQSKTRISHLPRVAPFTGAWIEIPRS